MDRQRELDAFVGRVSGLHARAVLDAAARELVDAFESAEIGYVVLKGPVLARLLYTPGEHRGYTDVDLLVAPHHLPAARRELSAQITSAVAPVERSSPATPAKPWPRWSRTSLSSSPGGDHS